jgi:hypothetical protein
VVSTAPLLFLMIEQSDASDPRARPFRIASSHGNPFMTESRFLDRRSFLIAAGAVGLAGTQARAQASFPAARST